jgi:hypothetical protein
MNTQTTTTTNAQAADIVRAAILSANPDLQGQAFDELFNTTMQALTANGVRRVRDIKPVAKAIDTLTSAQKAGDDLLSAAIRPSRSRRNAQQTAAGADTGEETPNRWVVNYTFSTWNIALQFARAWSDRIGINFQVMRLNRGTFSVSIPLIEAPKKQVTISAIFNRPGATADFAAALKGLQV